MVPEADDAAIDQLLRNAFTTPPRVVGRHDVGGGRGAFSTVVRLELDHDETHNGPATLVAKLPGPNRAGAITTGAFDREAISYGRLLDGTVATPRCWATAVSDDGAVAFLLDDLTTLRRVDQLHGLDADDTLTVADGLAALHRRWSTAPPSAVRRHTPAGLPAAGIEQGLEAVVARFGDLVDPTPFRILAARRSEWLDRFVEGPVTLCHGDPRADNLVFDDGAASPHRVMLFDWQQIAVQAGEADLAWLLATSLDPAVRRTIEHSVVERYADAVGRSVDDCWDRYRTSAVLPGLAVLFLAQRELTDERTRVLVTVSLQRIAEFVLDALSRS